MPTSHPEAGLTLAELLVVLALLALAAGVVVGRARVAPALQEEALRAFLRAARADAMETDRDVVLQAEGGVLRAGARQIDLGQAPVLEGPLLFRPDGSGAGALRVGGFFLRIDTVTGALDAG